VLVGLLVATLALSGAMAYEALDAVRSHRATAESTLRDYAGIAAWEFSRRARGSLDYMMEVALWPIHKMPPATPQQLLPSPASVAERAKTYVCDCPRAAHVRFYFRVDLRDGSVATSMDHASPWFLSWLADTITALVPSVAERPEWNYTLLAGPLAERSDVIAFTLLGGTDGGPRAAYGFHAEFDGLHDVFEKWCGEKALLPPSISGDQPNDSLLHLAVMTRDGRPVYRSAVSYPETFAAQDTLGVRYGGLVARAAVRPEAAEQLVIGGLPRSRVPLLVGLLLLTASVGVATLIQLKRERELARLRDDFVSGVSHELRTPLAQIRMFAELLDSGKLRSDEERMRSTKVINQEARRLTHLVENVLHFSRVRRGTARLSRAEVDLGPLMDELVAGFMPLANARRVELRTEVDEGIIANVDGGALGQMVLNLLDNAVKYGPIGQTVVLRVQLVDERVRVAVDDQGPGIPEDERARVWEPYRRLQRDVNAAVGGSGIGLAVVRDLVEMHGGRAWIEAAPGGGTRFVLEIPGARRRGPEDAAVEAPEAPIEEASV
jgi:signal transduction histidine kinase